MHHQHQFISTPTIASLGFLFVTVTASAVSLTPLGYLSGAYNVASRAYGVSADGTVVVGASSSTANPQAFRWTSGTGMVGLGTLNPGDKGSSARGVSADGSVVVGASIGTFTSAFRWTSGTGMSGVGVGSLNGDDLADTRAAAVSANGNVVAGTSSAPILFDEAYRWTGGTGMVGLGGLPDRPDYLEATYAHGISADGAVVVGQSQTSGIYDVTEAFRWTSGAGMVGLGFLNGTDTYSVAQGVSGDGGVVVGSSSGIDGSEAFRWTSDTGMAGLGTLPGGSSSTAWAISADGSRIVGTSSDGSGTSIVLWDDGAPAVKLWDVLVAGGVNPALDGWTRLFEVTALSSDGRFAAGAGVRNGKVEAFLMDIGLGGNPSPVPDSGPGMFGAMTLMVTSCLGYRMRRRC